jgi:hypothetical protein
MRERFGPHCSLPPFFGRIVLISSSRFGLLCHCGIIMLNILGLSKLRMKPSTDLGRLRGPSYLQVSLPHVT